MSEIRAAGDFNLATAEIITSTGAKINIRDANIVGINIIENIRNKSITGEIMIQDAAAFVNGDLVHQTSTTVHPQDSTSVLSIGGTSSSQRFKGYISNVRVTKGSFLYNVDFTSPAEAMYG